MEVKKQVLEGRVNQVAIAEGPAVPLSVCDPPGSLV